MATSNHRAVCTASKEDIRATILHLNEKRNQILPQMGQAEEWFHAKDTIDEYNRIMNDIHRLHQSLLGDPLMILPHELWEDIIHHLLSFHDPDPLVWDIDQPILLTSVSKSWQTAVLSTPSFWVNIRIDSEVHDVAAKVALCLNLSNHAPLNIALQIPTPQHSQDLLSMIASNSSRIRSIRLTQRWSMADDLKPYINSILWRFGRLPALEELDVNIFSDTEPILDEIIETSTSIRHIRGVKLSNKTCKLQAMRNIRSIATNESMSSVYSHLITLTSLKTIHLYSKIDSQRAWGTTQEESANPANVQHLLWTEFTCTQASGQELIGLLKQFSITMVNMSVNLDWERLFEALSVCSQMESLRFLTLGLIYYRDVEAKSTPIICASRIQHLTINTSGLGFRLSPFSTTEGKEFHQNIFRTLITHSPQVQDLSVNTSGEVFDVISYAETLHHLKKFTLHSILRRDLGLEGLTAENLTLRAHLEPFSSFYSSIELRNTIESRGASLPKRPPSINYVRCSNIQTLDLGHSPAIRIEWAEISLPCLSKITFGHSIGNTPPENQFYREVALRPSKFPSLTHIANRGIPSWDIVFIMLERRNFLTDTNIQPIKTLSFLLQPNSFVLNPLVDRLNQKLSARPSNFELSLLSTKDIYFDQQIPGCTVCHGAFRYCGEPCRTTKRRKRLAEAILRLDLIEYPAITEDILLTQPTRDATWDNAANNSMHRTTHCHRSLPGCLVEVSGNTIADTTPFLCGI